MTDREQYMKEWRAKNRQHLNDYQAERRRKDPEESRAINRRSAAKRRARDPKAESERVRTWKRLNRHRLKEYERRYKEKHPLKTIAHSMVHTATRSGVLVKPGQCECCGKDVKARALHAHHADYSKPLDVAWLCRGCHNSIHRDIKVRQQADNLAHGQRRTSA